MMLMFGLLYKVLQEETCIGQNLERETSKPTECVCSLFVSIPDVEFISESTEELFNIDTDVSHVKGNKVSNVVLL